MELVEYEETQSQCCAHQFTVLAPSQQKFQHHVVREQDVWRVATDCFSLKSFLLSRVAGEANGGLSFRITSLQELTEFLVLAVRQGVHRVHHDGLNVRLLVPGWDEHRCFLRWAARPANVPC